MHALELASALITVMKQDTDKEVAVKSLNEYMDSLIWKYC